MNVCPECGTVIPSHGSCRDQFDAILALEWEIPGGAGPVAHFYAVSSYILQHPDSMAYTADSLSWLRSAVQSMLAGEASIDSLRLGVRQRKKPMGSITRRDGDPIQTWGVRQWSMTVTGILEGGVDGYSQRVEQWASAVIGDLSKPGD